MSNIRAIVAVAVPAVTALLGLLWYFGRRKQPSPRRLVDPPDKDRKSTQAEGALSDTTDELKGITSTSKSEVSNGQVGQGSSNISASSTSLGKEHFDSLPTDKGDNISLGTSAQSTEASMAAVTDTGREIVEDPKVTVEEDVIQECVTKPSFTEHCNSDRSLQVSSEKSVGEKSLESVEAPVVESVISRTKVANVFTAPEASSPTLEQTFTAEKSQETKENISSNDMSPNSSIHAINSSLENKTSNHMSETDGLNKTVENLSSQCSEFDSQLVEQLDTFTGSWCENLPENENMTDLTENVSNVSSQKLCSIDNDEMRSEDNTVAAQETDQWLKTEKLKSDICSSKEITPVINSRTSAEVEESQSNLNSHTSQQSEKLSENNNNHSDLSSNCDNLSEASNDSGKGGSVQENTNTSPPDEDRLFEFNIPSDLCGLFIGTRGKTIKMISQQSGTKIRLQNNPYTRDFQICIMEGSKSGIETACDIIKRKFPAIKFPGIDATTAANPVIMPEIMQLSLPEGVSVDIVVSSIVDAGRVFLQQPTHPTYPLLERLNTFMNQCYIQEGTVPDIPRPIESGVICAAPMLNGWYRAQIMASHDGCDECDIKYVDYGGYSRVSSLLLKQIRSDFMTLPFEAVECYLANITPLENEQYFSTEAAVVLEELTQGQLLQGQVVGRAEDGIPYVHVYQIHGANSALLVNREMVNRGVVRWIELME